MSLDLDARQRAMLAEMGVRVWHRPAGEETPVSAAAPTAPRSTAAPASAPTGQSATNPRPAAATTPGPTAAPTPAINPIELAAANGAPMSWPVLAQAIANCQACALCTGRKMAVLGAAPDQPQAHWLVVGEPPDELEEREGRSFAGAAGQLLDNMLRAIGARRGDSGPSGAYLTNIVKCRPATPRNPTPQELATCQAYLQQEIALVKPKLILAMGRFAAQSLLQSSVPNIAGVPLGKLRGLVYRYQGIPVVVSYHPTYLLRTQADKAKAWADLCLAMATLDAVASDSS